MAYNSGVLSSEERPGPGAPAGVVLIPRPDEATLVIAAPGSGHGYWAGGPSAVATEEWNYLAYRLRRPVGHGRGYANAIAFAFAPDGEHFETIATPFHVKFSGCEGFST